MFGVGIAKRLNDVRWTTAQRMAAAWVITLPAAATAAGLAFLVLNALPHTQAMAVAVH